MSADFNHLKSKAIDFFRNNAVPETVERCLNELFFANPRDVNGYISVYFEKLSDVPAFSRMEAYERVGECGGAAISVRVYGLFRNQFITLADISVPNFLSVRPGTAPSSDQLLVNSTTIKECIRMINEQLNEVVSGLDLRNIATIHSALKANSNPLKAAFDEEQRQHIETDSGGIDIKIKSDSGKKGNKKPPAILIIPDDPPQPLCPLLCAHFASSAALTVAGAHIEGKSLTQFICDCPTNSPMLPMVSVFRGGKGLPGKCQLVKRCLVMPNGLYTNSEQVATDLRQLTQRIWTAVLGKLPATISSEAGELVPAYDRPEQFLDILMDALRELQLDESIRIVLEVEGKSIFDYDKGKYEIIVGQMKTPDEMVLLYTDLIERYPLIVGIVDPFRKKDEESWMKLGKAISSRCWVLGTSPDIFPRVETIADVSFNFDEYPITSVICLNVDGSSLIQDFIRCASLMKDRNQMYGFWLDDLDQNEWLVELTHGLQTSLVALPGIRCLSGAIKLNKWVCLTSKCPTQIGLIFPVLFPESEIMEDNVGESQSN